MIESDRTFAVATDEALVGLITRARNRLVVIAPALTLAVAGALARRFDDIGNLDAFLRPIPLRPLGNRMAR
jgi:hypothetical protein